MQTFLPYPNFWLSAKVLDDKRLGKQRVECKQILKALCGEYDGTGAWVQHPATKMWRGYEGALCKYGYFICNEWVNRGFNDTLLDYFKTHPKMDWEQNNPFWFDDRPEVFASHRSNLLRKDLSYYSQYGWVESPDLPYVWPV